MAIFKTNGGLNNANTAFVCSIPTIGNNNNPGTRESPVATIGKAITLGKPNVLFLGNTIENIYFGGLTNLIFEGESIVNGNISGSTYPAISYSYVNCLDLSPDNNNYTSYAAYINVNSVGGCGFNHISNSKVNTFILSGLASNITIIDAINNCHFSSNILTNCLVINSIDLYPYSGQLNIFPILKNTLFRKIVSWKWNGTVIPITWGNNPDNYFADVISSLTTYANSLLAGSYKTYLQTLILTSFYSDPVTGQTNKVIDDNIHPIFNKYNGTAIVDYTLLLDSNNQALFMGNATISQYVGCYEPNIGGMTFGTITNVNSDGTDDLVTTPDMLMVDSNGNFFASQNSIQYRNRVRTNVLEFKRGYLPLNAQSDLQSALNNGFSFGKKRIQSSIQLPCESIEVIPYDTPTNTSAFPRYSMPFNGNAQMFYKLSDNTPVLFNDLSGLGVTTDINLTEYGAYAVTTADIESYALSALSTVILKNIVLKFMQLELNLNYNL